MFTIVGACCFAGALTSLYKNRRRGGFFANPSRLCVVLMLIAGCALLGSGAVGRLVETLSATAGQAATSLTAQAFGVGTPLVLLVVGIWWLVHDWRTEEIEPATPWIALLLPGMAPVLIGLASSIGGVLAPIGTTLTAVVGG